MKKRKFATAMTTSIAAILLSSALNPALAQATTVFAANDSATATVTQEHSSSQATGPAVTNEQTDQSVAQLNDSTLANDSITTAATATMNDDETAAATPEMFATNIDEGDHPSDDPQPAVAKTDAVVGATTKLPLAEATNQDINVWLPNKTLQKIVLYWLNQNADTAGKTWTDVSQISQTDLQYLTKISNFDGFPTDGAYQELRNTYIDGESSYSLAGLEYATNLTHLELRSGDLNYAANDAIRGDITDLSPLAGLTKLKVIELTGNRITDVTPIAALPAVKEIHVQYNSIADLSSLDPKRYDQLEYHNQFVVLPVAYIDPAVDRYQMPMDQIKLPGGQVATASIPAGAGTAVRIMVDAARYFYKGAEGTVTDGQVVYSKFREQMAPGFTELPNLPTKVVQNPYYFYMSSIAGESADDTTFQVFQPYLNQKDLAALKVHDSTIYVGEDWQAAANFDQAVDHNGQPLALDQVTVKGSVDTTRPGTYPVTYEYDGVSQIANVTVLANQSTIKAHDQTLKLGESWDPQKGFDQATDRDGQPPNYCWCFSTYNKTCIDDNLVFN